MPITTLPDAPLPTDTPSVFNAKSFAHVAALNGFVTEANALETNVNSKEASTVSNAAAALTNKNLSEASKNAAASSEIAAAASATSAANSATASSASSVTAGTSATAAATSATNAATSATQAAASASSAAAIVTGVASNRPSVRPSLLLDFANTKQLDPRITFTRASTASFYDGKTVAKSEENLFLYSEQFDNAAWTALRSTVTANSTTSPSGASTADSLIQTTGQTTSGAVYPLADITVSILPYVFSVYAKPNGKNFIRLATTGSTGSLVGCYFNISTGVIGTTDAGVTGSIASAGNGYYRCSIFFTPNASRASTNRVFLADTDNSSTVVDSGGIYLWGAQLEQRASLTDYTPTTSAPITNYIPVLLTAASGVPRFDHNPTTGESLGFLVEEQRVNLFTYSEQFDNAAWGKVNSTVLANDVVAPDGNLTADAITPTASGAYINQTFSSSNATYTISAYAKSNTTGCYLSLLLQPSYANRVGARFDIINGTVIGASTPGGSTSILIGTSITAVGNGWYRCSLSATMPTGSSAIAYIGSSDSTQGNTDPFNSSTFRTVYVWGAQIELGAFPTSYIPTVASQVTRSGDSTSMTGTNFSSWYRQGEGAMYAIGSSNYGAHPAGSNGGIFTINDNTSSNFISIWKSQLSSNYEAVINTNGVGVVSATVATATAPNQELKTAIAYKVNDIAMVGNGGTVTTDSSATIPVVNQLQIGWGIALGWQFNGTIKRIAYYPKRLSNTELQGVTA